MDLIKRSKCPFCSSIKLNSLFKVKFEEKKIKNFLVNYYKNRFPIKLVSNKYYDLINCNNCSGIFQSYIPDETFSNLLYNEIISEEESWLKKKNNENNTRKKYHRIFRLIKSLLQKDNSEIKILEFGAGWGVWSKFMTSLNFKVDTIEISNAKINFLKENNLKNYLKIEELNSKYDLIYSEEVLEHLPLPRGTLFQLSKHLNSDGYMIHLFPSSYMFKLKLKFNYQPKKDCAHPLEHINLFNKECFEKMLNGSDLKILNLSYINNLNLIENIKNIKNNYLFNQVILKKLKK